MTGALARIEARHLARSPLLWLGVALALAGAAIELSAFWPALAGDDLVAYRDGFVVGGGALLAGAWLGLRDRVSGAADLVAVTPTAPWRLWRARLAAVAVVAPGAFAVVFAAGLAFSAARGGRGVPDLRLLADGALAVVLGGWAGLAVGRLSGSRVVPLLVASLWVAVLFVASLTVLTNLRPSVQRLSPVLSFEDRSAVFGFLPDALWPHLGYLLGLVLLAGVLLLALAGRGSAQRPALRPVLAVALAALVLVGVSGARLLALPDRLLVVGPASSERVAAGFRYDESLSFLGESYAYPADDRARSCAGDATLSVCVYPAYGQRLARRVYQAMQPGVRLFAGLPGVPTRVRMVPSALEGRCRGTEVQLGEMRGRYTQPIGQPDGSYADLYVRCALATPVASNNDVPEGAREVVRLWAALTSGLVTRQEIQRAIQTGGTTGFVLPTEATAAAALAMAELPPAQVRAKLAANWERLRAGRLSVSELPGQRR
jgi:hypothetical protein